MMSLVPWPPLAVCLCAILFFYLGTRHQRLLPSPIPRALCLSGGGLALAAALAFWLVDLQLFTALFTCLAVAMVCFIALPCLLALLGWGRP